LATIDVNVVLSNVRLTAAFAVKPVPVAVTVELALPEVGDSVNVGAAVVVVLAVVVVSALVKLFTMVAVSALALRL
jgi:hypothetical protein